MKLVSKMVFLFVCLSVFEMEVESHTVSGQVSYGFLLCVSSINMRFQAISICDVKYINLGHKIRELGNPLPMHLVHLLTPIKYFNCQAK